MKRTLILLLLLCALLTGCGNGTRPAPPASAPSHQEEQEYPDPPREDGTGLWHYQAVYDGEAISYQFRDVRVAVPANWAGEYALEQHGDRSVTFFHKARRLQLLEKGRKGGGELFTVHAAADRSEAEQPEHFRLGDTEGLSYYLSFPAEVPGDPSDPIAQRWAQLTGEAAYVKEHARMNGTGET